ncbi:hypothetical protein [Pyrobaculum islandicum]|uniref:hypothetical protein n=1 Tax=Pyrobaculum islandicum TaxID=2277 RepID=UPI001432FBAD|nr:hypothetical protein [Pyrobaculum islandicum]
MALYVAETGISVGYRRRMGAGQKFHKTNPQRRREGGVERHLSAMLLTFAATRTTVVVSNVLTPAGVIRRRCRPSRCSYQCR